jgi:tetraacyldisaccharide 4'-kinase
VLLGLLCLLSLAYLLVLKAYLGLYRLKIIRPARLRPFVIGIGNLTLGGTGKTTLAALLGRRLIEKGARVGILLRGHTGRFSRSARLVSTPTSVLMGPAEAGDEAFLLAREVPGALVAVGKDRRKSARLVESEFPPDILLLDDSFQYWRVKKDLEILLWDASQPPRLHRLFPRGILREPLSHLRRADRIWLTRSDQSPELQTHRRAIQDVLPGRPMLMLGQEPSAVHRFDSSEETPLEVLRGKRVLGFAAVGNPRAFERSVAACGVSIAYSVTFPDHYQYQARDLQRLFQVASELAVDYLVTTPKDQVRLESLASPESAISPPVPILVLETRIRPLEKDLSLEDIFEEIWQRWQQHLLPEPDSETTTDVASQES